MVIEQQISARRDRAHGSIVRILTRPDGNLYGDYSVRSASNKTYRVAMRGPGLCDNYCSCPDLGQHLGNMQAHRGFARSVA
jgi:hypothetical protein